MDGRQGISRQPSGPSLSSGSTPSPCEGSRESVQLPSMTSWAPPSSCLPSQSSTSSPKLGSGSNNTPIMYPGSVRNQKRRQSDAEEVEAGIALAGLGMTRAGSDMSVKKEAGGQTKRAKKEEGGAKKAEKDNKKSCSECRRLKAKCDRVFPCSNCASGHFVSAMYKLTTRPTTRVCPCLPRRRFELHAGQAARTCFY